MTDPFDFGYWNTKALKEYGLRIDSIPIQSNTGILISHRERYEILADIVTRVTNGNISVEEIFLGLADFPILTNLFITYGINNYNERIAEDRQLSVDTVTFLVAHQGYAYPLFLRDLKYMTTRAVRDEIIQEFPISKTAIKWLKELDTK